MTAIVLALRSAWGSLLRAKIRSLLTALGILIGTAAVVVVVALGTGARERIGGEIQSLGSNLLFVFSRSAAKSGARVVGRSSLTEEDAAAIRNEASAVSEVTVYSEVKTQVVSELGNTKTSVIGVDGFYFSVRAFEVLSGRNWSASEEQTKAKVALIGATAARNLFGAEDPVGRFVRVGRYPFRIIATLKPKGQSPFEDQDDRIVMPIGSYRARLAPALGRSVQMLVASAKTAAHSPVAERQIDAILRQRHRLDAEEEADFQVRTQAQFLKTQEAIFGAVTALLLSVAAIALFAGGVGVMNIMLVSVAERTREIGMRMAIGARPSNIQLQFLAEAILLTLIGGLAGVLFARGVVEVMTRALGWSMRFSSEAVIMALATSAFVGVLFGYLPARRAAGLDPVEALRHE